MGAAAGVDAVLEIFEVHGVGIDVHEALPADDGHLNTLKFTSAKRESASALAGKHCL